MDHTLLLDTKIGHHREYLTDEVPNLKLIFQNIAQSNDNKKLSDCRTKISTIELLFTSNLINSVRGRL